MVVVPLKSVLITSFLIFSSTAFATPKVPASTPTVDCGALLKPLINFDLKTFEYHGLTADGLRALRSARDIARSRSRLFETAFRGLSDLAPSGRHRGRVPYVMETLGESVQDGICTGTLMQPEVQVRAA